MAKKKAVKAAAVVRKPVKEAASTPVSTRRSRALTTMAAMKGQLGTMVDERARARATSGERWSARKPR